MELDDFSFQDAWRELTDEQRSEIGARGFDRINKLTSYVYEGIDVLRRAQEKLQVHPGATQAAWPEPMDFAVLAEREPQAPHFIIDDWLPVGYATLLAGHGGVGKSGIALYLAVCIAMGLPFFGLKVERRRVLYLSCEDRENVLHWRLSRICKHLSISLAELDGWLNVVDLVGHDCVLWERDPRTGNTVTAAYGELETRMQEQKTEVLVVDGISDTFGGNENVRSEVKRYVNALVALIPADAGAVLLVGHLAKPAASGAQTTEGYSGSTAWHNSVRARWYLYPETTRGEDGDKERTGDLLLELQKSNLGRTDQALRFAWDDQAHLFLGREIVAANALDRAHRDHIEQRGIIRSMQACADTDVPVPAAMQGPRTAYLVLSQRAEFPGSLRGGGRTKTHRFRRHIEALRHIRHITESSMQRTNRHYVATLVLTAEACAECV